MKISNFSRIILLPLILLISCIDEYWPEMQKYDNLLVVDGVFSNGEGPFIVRLSQSANINTSYFMPYQNCEVKILDMNGVEQKLIENEPGNYFTTNEEFVGQPGEHYKLVIHTPEGKTYESSYELLPEPVEIDTIRNVIENHQSDFDDHDLAGYQFYIDTELSDFDSTYFWWSLEETYEYTSDFTIEYIYEGSIKPFYNWDTLFTCWRTSQVPNIFVSSTEKLSSSRITNFPLNYVDTETRKLSIRYSLLVKQHTIDIRAYEYWNEIKTQINDGGSLYTTQPYQVRGNVTNINDPEEPVLGYFFVTGLSQRRIFVNPPAVSFYYSTCLPIFDMNLGFSRPWQWPIYITLIDGIYATADVGCFNCTSKGGKTSKPDFWHYNN